MAAKAETDSETEKIKEKQTQMLSIFPVLLDNNITYLTRGMQVILYLLSVCVCVYQIKTVLLQGLRCGHVIKTT